MNIVLLIAIFIILYLSFDNIEPFINDIDYDDLVYIPTRGTNSNGMLNNYHMRAIPEHEKSSGFLSDVYDYMGLDSHHYLFESPHKNDKEYTYNKSYASYFDRPITYTDETKKEIFLNKIMEKDNTLVVEPHKYRHPERLGNKIVYDFSNSQDFEHGLRERELRLRGFRRSSLTPENNYFSMTFCDDIDEMGTRFPCHKYGKKFDYDLENRFKIAKYIKSDSEEYKNIGKIESENINRYSSNLCCKNHFL
tara:strand:- start:607 stop:1356 length:750 start_codon:yes stop_codon:yes gene_type:complete